MRDISDEILLAGFCVCKHDVGITITADLYDLEQGLYLLVFFLLAAGEGEGVRPLESGSGKDAAKQKESSQQEPPFLFHQNTSILLCCLYYTESFCGGKVRSKIFIKSLPIFHLTNLKRKHRIEGNRFIHV